MRGTRSTRTSRRTRNRRRPDGSRRSEIVEGAERDPLIPVSSGRARPSRSAEADRDALRAGEREHALEPGVPCACSTRHLRFDVGHCVIDGLDDPRAGAGQVPLLLPRASVTPLDHRAGVTEDRSLRKALHELAQDERDDRDRDLAGRDRLRQPLLQCGARLADVDDRVGLVVLGERLWPRLPVGDREARRLRC